VRAFPAIAPILAVWGLAVWGLALWGLAAGAASAATDPFANWAAIFVAGDWRAHSGRPSEVFDNARRDLATAFERAGFRAGNVAQFSTHPEHYAHAPPFATEPDAIHGELDRLASQAKDGCLVYFTSHGSPEAMVLGDGYLTPAGVAALVDEACGDRPTVVVVAACYSGIFVPSLAGPNRMVMSAARPDRTSFGCGEADRYTFFDTCMLQSLPHAHDFAALAQAVRACVATREHDLGAEPPSEPQLDIGPLLRPLLPLYAFAGP
jgi:hypothetical protein